MMYRFTRLLSLGICLLFVVSARRPDKRRVLLKDVTALNLRRGEMTTGGRTAPVKQLECVGRYCDEADLSVVQCVQTGFDGVDATWECHADLPTHLKFDSLSVGCEGFSEPDDPYITAGSCGLTYSLKRVGSSHPNNDRQRRPSSRTGERLDAKRVGGDYGYRAGESAGHSDYSTSTPTGGFSWSTLIMLAVVAFIGYNVCFGTRQRNPGPSVNQHGGGGGGGSGSGSGGGGGGSGSGSGFGGGAYRNNNNNNNNKGWTKKEPSVKKEYTQTRPNDAAAAAARTGTTTANGGGGGWASHLGSAAAGAAAGYMMGRRGHSSHSASRRSTGFGSSSGLRSPSMFGSAARTSTRSAPRRTTPSGGSTTHRATGFASTTRR